MSSLKRSSEDKPPRAKRHKVSAKGQSDTRKQLQQKLKCCICYELLTNPVRVANCSHVVCLECAYSLIWRQAGWIHHSEEGIPIPQLKDTACPMCRSPTVGLEPSDQSLRETLSVLHEDEEEKACPVHDCGHQSPSYDGLLRHIKHECKHAFTCPRCGDGIRVSAPTEWCPLDDSYLETLNAMLHNHFRDECRTFHSGTFVGTLDQAIQLQNMSDNIQQMMNETPNQSSDAFRQLATLLQQLLATMMSSGDNSHP